MFTRIAIPVLLVVGLLAGQDGPRARQRAYQAMQQGEVGVAVDAFREATVATPLDAALRKDFAYALLKVGDSTAARDQFAEAARLNSKDSHAALEYAFLCHETGKQPEAWALFRKLRNAPDPEHRATARATFDRLDAELRTTIARLQEALARNPSDDSGHVELARTYTVRNEFAKAAAHFEAAFRLKPGIPSLLLDLQGAALTAGDLEKARAAALAASRSASAYVAEQARALLPARYPYLYEFQNALALDAGNTTLRREMGFFLLSLNRREEASAAFQQVIADAPRDPLANAQFGFLLWEDGKRAEALPRLRVAQAEGDATLRSRVDGLLAEGAPAGAGNEFPAREEMPAKAVAPGGTMPADTPVPSVETPVQPADTPASPTSRTAPMQPTAADGPALAPLPESSLSAFQQADQVREMGRKSYDNGFLPDAIRYYRQAHELDPTNFDTMLQLAYSLNMAKQDQDAIQWFFLAARSPEPAIAEKATTALRNLTAPAASGAAQAAANTTASGVVSSFWAMPMHSTRWGSTFAYSQAKAELQQPGWAVVPYLSLRFVGDTTGAVGQANPQFLSENAFIVGGGLRTKPRQGLLLWAEAGSAMAYLGSQRRQTANFAPDYRGGVSQFKLFGPSLVAKQVGWFAETMNDLVYIHRFNRDTLAISRNRIGHHFGSKEGLGGLQLQVFLNLNANTDFKREAWANFVEAGPGVRFRWDWMPPSVSFTFSALRGHHTIPRTDSRPNTYTDFQVGLWYAYTR